MILTHSDWLYDEAYGPHPMTRRRCPRSEWDDPTWIAVVVDDSYMAAENQRAVGNRLPTFRYRRRVFGCAAVQGPRS